MNNTDSGPSRRKKWGRALALVFGLLLLAVGTLHVIHGDYVMAPPSFLVGFVLVYMGVSGGSQSP